MTRRAESRNRRAARRRSGPPCGASRSCCRSSSRRRCFAPSTASGSCRKCSPISGSIISTSSQTRASPALSHGLRARRHPAARARALPRSSGRDREEPGDALLSRQRPQRRPGVCGESQSRPRPAPARRPPSRRAAGGREITPEMMEQVRQNIPTGINENYARELLELHTLGVDGGFTQQDIVNVARALDRLDHRPAAQRRGRTVLVQRRACTTRATRSCSGRGSRAAASRTASGCSICWRGTRPRRGSSPTKLARRFVADEPPAALVDRAAATFRATDGDLREVVRVDRDLAGVLRAPRRRRAKVKTPFEFVVSALRATGADVQDTRPLARTLQQQGMPLYLCQPPTGTRRRPTRG